MSEELACRPDCGACCIAPQISSPIPGMPNGKPAGVRCVQLDQNNSCMIFNDVRRPAVCKAFKPTRDVCQYSRDQALEALTRLELLTSP